MYLPYNLFAYRYSIYLNVIMENSSVAQLCRYIIYLIGNQTLPMQMKNERGGNKH